MIKIHLDNNLKIEENLINLTFLVKRQKSRLALFFFLIARADCLTGHAGTEKVQLVKRIALELVPALILAVLYV